MGRYITEIHENKPALSADRNNGIVTIPLSLSACKSTIRTQDKAPAQFRYSLDVVLQHYRQISAENLVDEFSQLSVGASTKVGLKRARSAFNMKSCCLAGETNTSVMTREKFFEDESAYGLKKNESCDSNNTWQIPMFSTPAKSRRNVVHAMMRPENVLSASRSESSRKQRPLYMTKDSNSQGFLVLDVNERLREVDTQFSSMKNVMNESLVDRRSLEEVVERTTLRGT